MDVEAGIEHVDRGVEKNVDIEDRFNGNSS